MQRIEIGGWSNDIETNGLKDDSYDDDSRKSKDDFDIEAFHHNDNNTNTIHTFARKSQQSDNCRINIMNISPTAMAIDNDGDTADVFSSVNVILRCRNLTVMTPDSTRVLIGDINRNRGPLSLLSSSIQTETGVNLSIVKSDRLLIVGPSGCGKSSLIRVFAGLWEMGSGDVIWNSDMILSEEDIHTKSTDSYDLSTNNDNELRRLPTGILFLPQKPYNIIGSLRQQIIYPSTINDDDDWSSQADSQLLDILERVKLGDLALRVGNGNERKGLNTTKDWTKLLSLGEQQRLSFARILYNKPTVVVLDESTSALDKEAEEAVFSLLIKNNITFISVGHNASLLKFHNKKLVIYGPTQNLKIENIIHSNSNNNSNTKLF